MTDSRFPPSWVTTSHPPQTSLHRHRPSENGSDTSPRGRPSQPDSWTDETFLLTPPAQAVPTNPIDQALTEQNIQAFQANNQAFSHNAQIHISPVAANGLNILHHDPLQVLSGLHIRTDVHAPRRSGSTYSADSESRLRSNSTSTLPRRAPSVRNLLHSSAGSVSPGTVISSPQIAAMLDITPLPSPTMAAFESWKALTRSRASSVSSIKDMAPPAFPIYNPSPTSPRRKGYPGLQPASRPSTSDGHDTSHDDPRTRSISDYVPELLVSPKPRHVAVSTSVRPPEKSVSLPMHREEYLGVERGVVDNSAASLSSPRIPEDEEVQFSHEEEPAPKRARLQVFHANRIVTGEPRSYEAIRLLGQGTFSKVYLAVRQMSHRKDSVDYRQDSINMAGVQARSRRLVAVKVVEHGPAGGADAERIEIGLKREVDILKAIQHPSLVHLKAFGNDGNLRALLVMNYCPGNDLFEVASKNRDVLVPPLVRRIFAELVSAVRYLHQKFIVHRDIKLESRFLCFSLPSSELLTDF